MANQPAQITQAVRLIALETVFVHIAKIALVQAGAPAGMIQALRENVKAKLQSCLVQPFVGGTGGSC